MKFKLNRFCLLVVLLFIATALQLHAQADKQPYVTNGTVSAIVRSGNVIYIGGSFGVVGPNIPYGSALDTATGAPKPAYPLPNGEVYITVSDGAGGWYIGGNFTQIDRKSVV